MAKLTIRFAIALLIILSMNEAKALQGGPDPYGYIWKDSDEPGGPVYDWIDISNKPNAVQVTGLADDNSAGPYNLGFAFHYYWADYTSLKIGSNGWISFENVANIAACFPQIPTPGGAGDNLICPFMSDLSFVSSFPSSPNIGEIWYWTNATLDTFVLQYKNVPWWQSGQPDWTGSNDVEMILTRKDSSITFQYKNVDALNFPGGTQCATFMEIGIENVTGDLGLASYSGTNIPPSNYAIKYYYPSNANFIVRDIKAEWNSNVDNGGIFVYTHSPMTLDANIKNIGNTAITDSIFLTGTVFDSLQDVVWSDDEILTGLAAGGNQTLSFNSSLSFNKPGQHSFIVNITNGQDINPTNNQVEVEVSVIRNLSGFIQMTYATSQGPDGSLAWSGGGAQDGVAQKMFPPDYPAVLNTVEFWISEDGDKNTVPPVGFTVAILGEDANGNPDPNNVLQVESVSAQNVIEDNWNVVLLDSSVTINSGAFFVAWMMQGSGLFIGTEGLGPKSRRGYELLGGTWGLYRDNETTEFLMRVNTTVPVAAEEALEMQTRLEVYPNPASNMANIRWRTPKGGSMKISLSSLTGQVVWEKEWLGVIPGEHTMELDLNGIPAGIYFVNLEKGGRQVTKKLVISGN